MLCSYDAEYQGEISMPELIQLNIRGGTQSDRAGLESLLQSESFWQICLNGVQSCFNDIHQTQLALLLFIRRLREKGCENATCSTLLESLLPLRLQLSDPASSHLILPPLCQILAFLAVKASVGTVQQILSCSSSDPIFCTTFLSEIGILVENEAKDRFEEIKQLEQSMLEYCYGCIIGDFDSTLHTKCAKCILHWFTSSLLSPQNLQQPQTSTVVSLLAALFPTNPPLQMFSHPDLCNVLSDLLDELGSQWMSLPYEEGGCISSRTSEIQHLTCCIAQSVPLFRQVMTETPGAFLTSFLPDCYAPSTVNIQNFPSSEVKSQVIACSHGFARLLGSLLKLLIQIPEQEGGAENEVFDGLLLLSSHREVCLASIAFETFIYCQSRMSPSRRNTSSSKHTHMYGLLLQGALRHCCSIFPRTDLDDEDHEEAILQEWRGTRDELVSEAFRVAYLELRAEALGLVFSVFQQYIQDHTDGNEGVESEETSPVAVSVISGCLYAVRMISLDLTKRALLGTATPGVLRTAAKTNKTDALALHQDAQSTTNFLLFLLNACIYPSAGIFAVDVIKIE